ncbi:MAG: ABC transporter permease [Candidatus Pseudobacter hemicellulosilyticus]|uniref:ABC transporter permease n=1 Tax=Candidatus Pseudobacter hemicellulosilyticus TaxID=3121375 RepID=A0AAJ5WW62_9BACT|nr:MAG: ABC transporter permease [Pseudobacter sp.]
MLYHYIRIAWRRLKLQKVYTLINVLGLAAGLAITLLIALWIKDESSFDHSFQHHERLAQVMVNQTHEGKIYTGATNAVPTAAALREQHGASFRHVSLVSWSGHQVISQGNTRLGGNSRWVEADFPEMFSLELLKGNRSALKDPSAVLISQSLATALFGQADPLYQIIRLNNSFDCTVAGIYIDFPHNSSFFDTQLLLPWTSSQNWMSTVSDWRNHCTQLYVQLADGVSAEQVSRQISQLPRPHFDNWKEELMLHPLDKAHLYTEFENGQATGGRIQYLWLTGLTGAIVLLLACINFMNLSTASSARRAREVGVRKTMGSLQRQLVGQFLIESVILAFIALLLAILLVSVSLPFFNDLAEKQMTIPWTDHRSWLLLLALTTLTGLVAGSYPAFYLSRFKPVLVLKGIFRAGRLAAMPRKVLVVVQFTVSVVLIIGTLIIFQQLKYARNRPAGYQRAGLITVGLNTPDLQQNSEALRNDLLQTGAVNNLAYSSYSPAHFSSNNSVNWAGKDPNNIVFFRNVSVSFDFGKTIGWDMVAGRDFSSAFATDTMATILNETAARITGFADPIGQTIRFHDKHYTIIGIANDLLTQSPYDPIEPAIFFPDGWKGVMTLRINAGYPIQDALDRIGKVFRKHNPQAPFEYNFVDEAYGRKYAIEEKISKLSGVFAGLAIFISCLGLFGLSAYMAEQRTREIGVRKVMGATVFQLWQLLSRDFLKPVLIAFLLAAPLAFYLLHSWLQQYAYRTPIQWWWFAGTGIVALLIALLTVSYQTIRASLANPVKSLRSE